MNKIYTKINNWLNKVLDKWIEKLSNEIAENIPSPVPIQTEPTPEQSPEPTPEPAPEPVTPTPSPTPTPTPPEEVSYDNLDFCWGGFKKKNAKVAANIKNLSVKASGMSYSWSAGGCESLGASDKGDAGKTLACLFCRIDGKWKGGKFDWISTSRTTRDFKNIKEGYNGWDKQAIDKASEYAFCIVSTVKDLRTNVISCKKNFKAQSTTSEVLGIIKQLLSFFVSRSDRKIKKQDDIMDKIDGLKQQQKKALQEGRIGDASSIAKEIEQLYKKFNKIGFFSCLALCCMLVLGCKSEKVNQSFNTPTVIGERVRIVEPGKAMKIPQLQPPAKKWYLVDDVGLCQWLNIPSEAQP